MSQKSVRIAQFRAMTHLLHLGTLLWFLLGSDQVDPMLDGTIWSALLFLGIVGVTSTSCVRGSQKLRNGMIWMIAVTVILGESLYFAQGFFETITNGVPLVAFAVLGGLNVWSLWSKTTRYASYDRAMELCRQFGPRGGPICQRVIHEYFQQQCVAATTEFVGVAECEGVDSGADVEALPNTKKAGGKEDMAPSVESIA